MGFRSFTFPLNQAFKDKEEKELRWQRHRQGGWWPATTRSRRPASGWCWPTKGDVGPVAGNRAGKNIGEQGGWGGSFGPPSVASGMAVLVEGLGRRRCLLRGGSGLVMSCRTGREKGKAERGSEAGGEWSRVRGCRVERALNEGDQNYLRLTLI